MIGMILQGAGVVIVSAVVVKVLMLLVTSWRQGVYKQKQYQLAIELLHHRVAAAKAVSLERERTCLSWDGPRKFVLTKKVPEAQGICSFYLTPHDGKPLPPFKPGQHLTFKLHIPGKNNPFIRCYSLSDSPNHPEQYRVSIKKIPPPDSSDLPPGLVSNYFHDQLREGDILDVKAPSGNFFLDVTQDSPIVLIAGGVGITPLLSMLNTIIESGSLREVWFFLGVRNGSEHMMKEHLSGLARDFDTLHLHVCYSKPNPEDIMGRDYHHVGHVDIGLLRSLLPSSNYEFYICGPPSMMGTITRELGTWGVPDDKIHYESFGPASVKKVGPPGEGVVSCPGLTVMFAKGGKTVIWGPTEGSLLELSEAHGIIPDFGCRAGSCGTCVTAIKSGEVDYITRPGKMPEPGSCLICIAVPKSNLTLDL